VSSEHAFFPHVGFVGLGLMGGSLAQLIKQAHPETKISVFEKNPESVTYATINNIADKGCTSIDQFPKALDLVFICTPLPDILPSVEAISAHIEGPTIITDIGSVKKRVAENVRLSKPDHIFIAGHPLAGSEKQGIQFAHSSILQHSPYILIENSTHEFLRFKAYLSKLSFDVITMTADAHDRWISMASHFPYLMACLTTSVIRRGAATDPSSLQRVAGPGLRDTSRVAESSPDWGAAICQENKENIQASLSLLTSELQTLQTLLESDDETGLHDYFGSAQAFRKFLFPHA
jgi:prephenate dehydrogenase